MKELFKGIFEKNPILYYLLGLCPALAVTTNVKNAVTMGLSVIFVLFFSNVIISIIRKTVPHQVRIASYIVVIATFVTIADIFIKANYYEMSRALGPFIPLIVVNCIILGRAEAFASRHGVVSSMLDALGMGAGFTLVLCFMAAVREILGSGTFFGMKAVPGFFPQFLVMILPAGAFITLGLIVGLHRAVDMRIKKRDSGVKREAVR
ncbi:MAG: electron transport complex subunit E [Elusimicrobiota bacterium]|nr:electron transport complex subunit E [Elusimicrobiota bacterium]